jgi:excisionase family DNA binding protein
MPTTMPARAVTSVADGYLGLRELAEYSGLCVRTLRGYLVDRARPLPHYRIGGRVLVKKSEFDEWAAQFRIAPAPVSLDSLVDDVVGSLR